jgi:hypothetical protein
MEDDTPNACDTSDNIYQGVILHIKHFFLIFWRDSLDTLAGAPRKDPVALSTRPAKKCGWMVVPNFKVLVFFML